jgi:hypothetical protein
MTPAVVEAILDDGLTLYLKTGSPRAWELGFTGKYVLANPIEVQLLE